MNIGKRANSHDRNAWGSVLVRRATLCCHVGSSLIELALVIPLFTLLLLVAVEFGRLEYAEIEVTNAARAGVAYGAQNHITASDIAGMKQAALTDGSTDVTVLSATASNFCQCSNGSASTCLPTDCSGARILEFVQVNTTASINRVFNVNAIFSLFGVTGSQPATYNLQGQAIMRVTQ